MPIISRAALVALLALNLGLCSIFASSSLAAEDLLVVNAGNGTVYRFSDTGDALGVFASGLSSPLFITADRLGNVYVSEHGPIMGRITMFSPAGASRGMIETDFTPGGVRVGADGTIYVVDPLGGKINIYRPSGTVGSFPTSLAQAEFMALDTGGNLYVTDRARQVVRKFSPQGENLGDFVVASFIPSGIAFDAQGILYVASPRDNIVEKFKLGEKPEDTQDVERFASGDTGNDSFFGIAFDTSGNLYVANSAPKTIRKFDPTGQPLGVFESAGLDIPSDLVIVPRLSPTAKDDCKQDGWVTFDAFKTQGDCIQYVNTGK